MVITSNRPGQRKRAQVDLRYIDDVVLTTGNQAWTWVRLPDEPAGLPVADRIQTYVRENSAGLAKLATTSRDVIGHLRITHIPTDPEEWAKAQIDQSPNAVGPGLAQLVDHQVSRMHRIGHVDTRVHLGICLGSTSKENLWNTGPFKWFRKGTQAVERSADIAGEIVTVQELEALYGRANQVRSSLRASMKATPVDRDELTELILNATNPGMRPPRIKLPSRRFGPGLQEILFNDAVWPHARLIDYLDADDTPIMHAAYVCVAVTEDEYDVGFAEPWLYAGCQVGFPVDWSIRFKVRSPQATKGDLRKKAAHAKDMHQHMREAGKTPPLDLDESVALLEAFEHEVSKNKVPGLYAQYVARISDPDPDVLASKVATLRDAFHDHGVEMQWSTGDQMSYLLADIPGGPDRHRPYEQHSNLGLLFGGAPTWSHRVGDNRDPRRGKGRIGTSIGQTLTPVPQMVPFDPFNALLRDRAPGFMLTGSSGSGKTYLMQVIALNLALRGVSLTYIDPKGDVVDRVDRFRLPDLIYSLTGRRPHIIDTADSPDGILEPFRISDDPAESLHLALQVLEGLLGGDRSDSTEAALATAVNAESDDPDPTLSGVMQRLESAGEAGDPAAAALFQRLQMYRKMKYSRLLFGAKGRRAGQIGANGQVTFIVTRGLELPQENAGIKEMDVGQRLSSTILTLLARRATANLLTGDDDYPKALMVDESHVPMATRPGRKMIYSCIKMLRSKYGVVGLGSQELQDHVVAETGDEAILNNVTTYFGFRCQSASEAGRVLQVLDSRLDSTNDVLREMITGQETGECFMRDLDNRVEQITTDYYLDSLKLAFETNATRRAEITASQVAEALRREFDTTWTPRDPNHGVDALVVDSNDPAPLGGGGA